MTEEKPDVEKKQQNETKPKMFLNNICLVILSILASFVLIMLVSHMTPAPITSTVRTIENFIDIQPADETAKFHDDVIPESNNIYKQIFDFILIIVLTILCFILFKRTIKSTFRLVILITVMISIFCITFFSALSGKPAIYLYPEKPTKVNIKIDPNIFLTLDIPKYIPDKGWNVLAYPNGKIIDLQPQYTDCNKIASNRFGLEYGKKACLNNNYPYIYWEGLPKNKLLPKQTEGWLVKVVKIKEFLESKLDYVGFNKAEKDEFIRYWVHRVKETKRTTVFISFLQTDAVNAYHPMVVTPTPNSVNRFYIFVDPNIENHQDPTPQTLIKFKRDGFTLVDWGGMITQNHF